MFLTARKKEKLKEKEKIKYIDKQRERERKRKKVIMNLRAEISVVSGEKQSKAKDAKQFCSSA